MQRVITVKLLVETDDKANIDVVFITKDIQQELSSCSNDYQISEIIVGEILD